MRKMLGLTLILAAVLFAMAGCSNLLGGGSSGGGGGSGGTGDTSGVYGTISTATWTANTFVSDNLTVTGSLTIAAGVTVTLASDVYITIESGAFLSAVGSSSAPIVFTGKTVSTHWRQIYFNGSTSSSNKMSYCTVENAGSSSGSGYYAIELSSSSVADIEYCTIAGNLSGGLDASAAGSGSVVKSNAFYNNGQFGLRVNDNVSFDKTNSFKSASYTSNLYNDVSFVGNIAVSSSSTRVFDITEVPYYFDSSAEVTGTLTIKAGATLAFNTDCWLTINSSGVLVAAGEAGTGNGISFTSATSGHWRQIYFNGSTSSSNKMAYCTVENAGRSSGSGYYAIELSSSSVADIEYCTIAGNLSGGLDASAAGSGSVVKSNAFYNNGQFGLRVNDNVNFDKTNSFTSASYTSNLYNDVSFVGNIAVSSSSTRVFDITEVPYYFDSSAEVTGTLTINAGATLAFNTDCWLTINSSGVLVAAGEAGTGNGISFTSATSGHWRQIYFNGSTSSSNKMAYCTVENAGSSSGSGYYAIELSSSSVADIEYCTIGDNLAGGIEATNAGSGTLLSNNTFGDNGDASSPPYDLEYTTGYTSVDSSNTYSSVNEIIGE